MPPELEGSHEDRLTLGRTHFLAVAAVLLIGLASLVSLAWPALVEEYLLVVEAPPLEEAFGFRAEYQDLGRPDESCRTFALKSVAPEGRLAKLGFQEGDWLSIAMCRFWGDYEAANLFFDQLREVDAGNEVLFSIQRERDGERLLQQIRVPARHASLSNNE